MDRKSSEADRAEVRQLLEGLDNARMLEPALSVSWGGFSITLTALFGLSTLVEWSRDWDYFINLRYGACTCCGCVVLRVPGVRETRSLRGVFVVLTMCIQLLRLRRQNWYFFYNVGVGFVFFCVPLYPHIASAVVSSPCEKGSTVPAAIMGYGCGRLPNRYHRLTS